MKHRRLQELGESDFEIVDGQPDIRGWDVKNESDQTIGEVEELILDAQLRKVRYLLVDMEDNDLDLDDRQVLVPIGFAELDQEEEEVLLRGITKDQLGQLPEYDSDHLTPEVERTIATVLGRASASENIPTMNAGAGDEFYNHEHFRENNLYRRRLPGSSGEDARAGDGMLFRDRAGQSGSEVEGYMGREGSNLSERSGRYQEERIGEESSVPVNRNSLDDEEELRMNRSADDKSEEGDARDELPRGGRSI